MAQVGVTKLPTQHMLIPQFALFLSSQTPCLAFLLRWYQFYEHYKYFSPRIWKSSRTFFKFSKASTFISLKLVHEIDWWALDVEYTIIVERLLIQLENQSLLAILLFSHWHNGIADLYFCASSYANILISFGRSSQYTLAALIMYFTLMHNINIMHYYA
jgi:hypothetical protein